MTSLSTIPLPPERVGLLADQRPVPLTGVSVEAELRDFAARVVVSQRYRNAEAHPIEAVYVFPLEEGAAVCGFEAVIDGIHVVGRVEEREKAFADYDEALAAGHGAYLLDQERPDVFTASIGNVPPGKEVLVRISYVAELSLEGEELRFCLPTTVSPRYAPEEDRRGVGRTPAEALNPPVEWSVPYGLDLLVRLEMPSAIRAVESPSHPLRLETEGSRATVRLGSRETMLDRDFVLGVRLAEPHAPRAWLETDEAGRTTALVAFVPRFDAQEAPCEAVFVVDRSGSMNGSSIAEARNALQLCLRSLGEGSRFNVVGFGSTFAPLFPESRPYDQRSLAEASEHVRGIEADMGGTEILPALESVLAREPVAGLPRQLFVLTDGEVTNTEAVIALVRRHSGTARVFTFGIGAGASHHLVRGLARAGGGAAELIAPGERIEAKVLRQVGRALKPALTEVRLDWGALRASQAPHHLPPVFAGGRLLVYGFLEGEVGGEVTLSARGATGPVSFTVGIDPAQARHGSLLATLAARTMIRDLEEGASPLHDRRGSLQDRSRPDRVKDEIVRLGVAYGLVSRHTSFVAVEKRKTPAQGEAQLRRVPIALTSGWGGLDRVPSVGRAALRIGSASRAMVYHLRASAPAAFEMDATFAAAEADVAATWLPPLAAAQAEGFDHGASRTRPLDRLVALQGADGSWELTAELAAVLGWPLAELERRLGGAKDAESRRALATALALVWLEREAADERAEWELLARKARRWLERSSAKPRSARDWLELARAPAVQAP